MLSSRDDLRCFNHTARGTGTIARTIKRQDVEARVLRAMQDKFFEPGAFAEFCDAFTEEMNRLRREHRTKLAAAPREIESINRRSKEILELLLQGFRDERWKEELQTIGQRRTALKAITSVETEPALPALHPRMAKINFLTGRIDISPSHICFLIGQHAMDKRNGDRTFTHG